MILIFGGEMLKKAYMYCKKSHPSCDETRSFLEGNGVMVSLRDTKKDPLTKRELNKILGFQNPKHYLDQTSPAFTKMKLDEKLPDREEIIDLIMENPELLRQPIILSGRLMTVGCGKKQLVEMFQIKLSDNGSGKNRLENSKGNK